MKNSCNLMKKLKNLEDLFHHQLQDIYSAETQLVDALPKMEKRANEDKLKKAFSDHLKETKKQIERLEDIAETLDIDIEGETCKAMKGLISEAESFMAEGAEPNVQDAGIIADAQRIEHYEISAYGTVVEYAGALGKLEAKRLLEKTLEEEEKADDKLNKLAIDSINVKAKA